MSDPPTLPPAESGLESTTSTGARADAARFRVGDVEHAYLAFDDHPPAAFAGLTTAEASVARMVVAGLTNREIARARAVSPRTVANQLARVFERLGIASRHELIERVASGG